MFFSVPSFYPLRNYILINSKEDNEKTQSSTADLSERHCYYYLRILILAAFSPSLVCNLRK